MSKGRVAKAKELTEEYMEEDEQADLKHQKSDSRHGFTCLFSRKYIKATLFVSIFWVCNVTPYFAIGTFVPIVLEQLGLEDGLTAGLALNTIAVLGTLIAAALIERVGRRKLAIPPFAISTVALVIVAVFPHDSPTLVVVCFLAFSLVNAISTTLTGVFPNEMFPTEIRGVGVGFATAASRL